MMLHTFHQRAMPHANALLAGLALALVSTTTLLADEYTVMGQAEAVIDGEEMALWVPYDVEHDQPYAERIGSGGFAVISVEAFAGDPGSSIERPHVTISVFPAGPRITDVTMLMPDAPHTRVWMAGAESAGSIDSAEVSIDGAHVQFSIEASLVPEDITMGAVDGEQAAPDAEPVSLSITGELELNE